MVLFQRSIITHTPILTTVNLVMPIINFHIF